MTLRYKLKDLKIEAAEEAFKQVGQNSTPAASSSKRQRNPGDLKQTLAGPSRTQGSRHWLWRSC